MISALLGMPPNRTSSVASSQRRYEGDVESSDDPHEAGSLVEERPQPHPNRARRYVLGDVMPRPPLRRFASSEKVLATSSPLTITSLRAVGSANCGCVRPALCTSSFRTGSNRSGACFCACALPHCPLLASVSLLRPVPSYLSKRNRPYDHTHAHHLTPSISSSSTLLTPAHLASSMRLNAADRTAGTVRNS